MLLADGYLFMWEKRSASLDSCINRAYTPWAISANLVALSIPAKYYFNNIKITCASLFKENKPHANIIYV